MTAAKPAVRPARPFFSSGPCAKRPGWTPQVLDKAILGRSHRGKPGLKRIQEALALTRRVLEIPESHRIAIVPASDTGAVEMALWSMLGSRPVDVLAWESFGIDWAEDVVKQLKIKDARVLKAPYGRLPDLSEVNPADDVVFAWNGTTSGVRVPDGEWISATRAGLTICDATSAAFVMELPWEKLDVTTFSWQKALGGEAAHGMIVLSPRAVERLETYTPPRPLPKIFRMAKDGKLIEGLFRGETLNTPSMLCVEDWLDTLKWAEGAGGVKGLKARALANFAPLERFVLASSWLGFLAEEASTRSTTSVCLSFKEEWFKALSPEEQFAFARKVSDTLEAEHAAYDAGSHRAAPAGLRIWCGATVERNDVETLLPWLDWAYQNARAA